MSPMHVRKAFILALGLVGTSAFAEDSRSVAVAEIGGAMRQSGAYKILTMTMQGKQKLGENKEDNFSIYVYFDGNVTLEHPLPKLCVLEYLEETLVSKVVADGETLWVYGPQSNAYWAKGYAPANSLITPTTALFTKLSAVAKGQLVRIVQILDEIYSNKKSTDWTPFSSIAGYDNLGWFVQDSGSRKEKMFYDVNRGNPDFSGDDVIQSVYFEYSDIRMGAPRSIHWKADLGLGGFPQNPSVFKFVPPAGSRSVTTGR